MGNQKGWTSSTHRIPMGLIYLDTYYFTHKKINYELWISLTSPINRYSVDDFPSLGWRQESVATGRIWRKFLRRTFPTLQRQKDDFVQGFWKHSWQQFHWWWVVALPMTCVLLNFGSTNVTNIYHITYINILYLNVFLRWMGKVEHLPQIASCY